MNTIYRYLYFSYRKIFKRDLYNIGLICEPIHHSLVPHWRPTVHWLLEQSTSAAFIADPFGIEVDGKKYLLCEYFDYRERAGRIVATEIKDSTNFGPLLDAIAPKSHISYPFVFQHQGQVYCIPETSRSNEVSLYIAEELPYRWRKVALLLADIPALDPSIIYFNGYWWLFYGDRRVGPASLYISYASNPHGPWFPHEQRPVKSDIASSRPGGTPFVHNNKLYRPAQDCSKGFCDRVVINEILLLSPTEFMEKSVSVVEPDKAGPYPDGMHTLSAMGNWTFVDSKREQFIAAAVMRSMRVFLRKTFKMTRMGDL